MKDLLNVVENLIVQREMNLMKKQEDVKVKNVNSMSIMMKKKKNV